MPTPNHLVNVFSLLACALLAGCVSNSTDTDERAFRDCDGCPEMVWLAAGSYLMGTAEQDRLIDPRTGKPATNDGPQHRVSLVNDFAIGRHEVTVEQFATFVAATGHETVDRCMEFSKENSFEIRKDIDWGNTGFPQSPDQPVVCISYYDAAAYADWLAERSGKNYRLPTEAEWEYAARAGATGPYYWGSSEQQACGYANVRSAGADTISKRQAAADRDVGFPCDDGYRQSSPSGSFKANAFNLYDMQGNAWEWVSDCNHKDYTGAPTDGSAWLEESGKECRFGIIRGGSFLNLTERSSVTVRAGRPRGGAATNMGFRVALGTAESDATRRGERRWESGNSSGAEAGSRLFLDNCEACHIRNDDFEGLYGQSQQELEDAIRNGGNNVMSMPAFADILTDEEITTLAAFLRQQNNWQ
jgi:formylglycine-generating enzyme required for sulfatase activity